MRDWLAPKRFYAHANYCWPWLAVASLLCIGYGIIVGLFFAPVDYQQREAMRIIYIHVPCALLSLTIYTIIGCASIVTLIWKIKVADVVATVSAPLGMCVTALALFTGSMWGKPMWGTFWVWDARLTSELILLFLYIGYIALRRAIIDPHKAAQAAAILAVVGIIDIPIIHFSVEWWHTLHQGASITRFAKPAIALPILYPLLAMIVGMYLLYGFVVLYTARAQILWRERRSSWVQEIIGA